MEGGKWETNWRRRRRRRKLRSTKQGRKPLSSVLRRRRNRAFPARGAPVFWRICFVVLATRRSKRRCGSLKDLTTHKGTGPLRCRQFRQAPQSEFSPRLSHANLRRSTQETDRRLALTAWSELHALRWLFFPLIFYVNVFVSVFSYAP